MRSRDCFILACARDSSTWQGTQLGDMMYRMKSVGIPWRRLPTLNRVKTVLLPRTPSTLVHEHGVFRRQGFLVLFCWAAMICIGRVDATHGLRPWISHRFSASPYQRIRNRRSPATTKHPWSNQPISLQPTTRIPVAHPPYLAHHHPHISPPRSKKKQPKNPAPTAMQKSSPSPPPCPPPLPNWLPSTYYLPPVRTAVEK